MNRISVLILASLLSGCAGSFKKQVAADLTAIIQNSTDCDTACAALRAYVATKLK
jgi:hypothetical protein